MGAEAAAHATRTYRHHLPLDHTIVKLDFKNAFNTIRQDKMLEAAKKSILELFSYIFSCYSAPSTLFLHKTTLQLAEGVSRMIALAPFSFA